MALRIYSRSFGRNESRRCRENAYHQHAAARQRLLQERMVLVSARTTVDEIKAVNIDASKHNSNICLASNDVEMDKVNAT